MLKKLTIAAVATAVLLPAVFALSGCRRRRRDPNSLDLLREQGYGFGNEKNAKEYRDKIRNRDR